LLQDALGGSSVGLLICNLAPGTKFRQDTLNTLKYVVLLEYAVYDIWLTGFDSFATRTKNIENKPIINERGMSIQTHSFI